MNSRFEDYQHVANRFKWEDNNTIRVINYEGIERRIDLLDKFKEIEFNVIPMYQDNVCKRGHYFL
jgi:hypothetical protein